jgi:spore maturation protein CgeB
MYLSFSDESDLKEKLVRLITNSDLRKSMSEKARVHSLAHHTYRNRINTILAKTGFELLKNY